MARWRSTARPGAGTTLTLYSAAPRVAPSVAAHDGSGRHGRAAAACGVLLVEDDAEVRTVVRRFLEALGCQRDRRRAAANRRCWR